MLFAGPDGRRPDGSGDAFFGGLTGDELDGQAVQSVSNDGRVATGDDGARRRPRAQYLLHAVPQKRRSPWQAQQLLGHAKSTRGACGQDRPNFDQAPSACGIRSSGWSWS